MRKILTDTAEKDLNSCSYGFPWDRDSFCYKFRRPDEFIISGEISRLTDTEYERTGTLVIGCELDDYSFISKMKNLSQLYIYKGNKIRDLDFLQNLLYLSQIYIRDTHISSLDRLKTLLKNKNEKIGKTEALTDRIPYYIDGICIVTDGDLSGEKELAENGNIITELIINGKFIKK